jgi:hypothetical protein
LFKKAIPIFIAPSTLFRLNYAYSALGIFRALFLDQLGRIDMQNAYHKTQKNNPQI